MEIAHRHLIPNQLEQHGLTPQQLLIPHDSTKDIVSRYFLAGRLPETTDSCHSHDLTSDLTAGQRSGCWTCRLVKVQVGSVGCFRYTREAGVRSLERKIGAVCRAVAVRVAEAQEVPETPGSESPPPQDGESKV